MIFINFFSDIAEATGYQTAELWLLDQGKFASIVDFADKFEQDGEKIDILVANAGISSMEYNTTSDGYEETYVKTLSPHLLHPPNSQDSSQPSVYGVALRVAFASSAACGCRGIHTSHCSGL